MQNCFKFKSDKPKENNGYQQVRTNPIALDEVGEDSDWDGFDNWDSEDGRQKAPAAAPSLSSNKSSAVSVAVNDPPVHSSSTHSSSKLSQSSSSSSLTQNIPSVTTTNTNYTSSYATPTTATINTVPLPTLPTHTISNSNINSNIGSNVGSAVEQPVVEEAKPEIDVFKDLGMSPTYEAPRTKKVAPRPIPQPSIPLPQVTNYPVAPTVTSRAFTMDNLLAQEPKGSSVSKGGWGGDEDLDLGIDVTPDDEDDDSGKKKGFKRAPKQSREKKTAKKKGVGVQVIDDV